ncbi:ArsR/SmtB family transcription factor [Nucisporomicrobium flavum]|uniref:ArsR/SmtB family transcription factor n=1 Tax=Nucisporomicrobium flavum TaxID=2785915 RepID=UPI0018F3ED71|nr:DUF5937 family protein [Nucisporomicrobium flavum]
MPITLQLPAGRAPAVTFAVSPMVELAWAWHVLVGAEHHPERGEWAARVLGELPDDLAAELDAWSFAVRAVRATVFADPTLPLASGWDQAVTALRRMPPAQFAAAMLRPLLRVGGRSGDLADHRVRAELVALTRARGAGAVRAVRLVLEKPGAAQAAVVGLLEGCWSAFFAAEWRQIEPALCGEVRSRLGTSARGDLRAALSGLSPAIAVGEDGRVAIDKVQSKSLAVSERGLVLVPTVFGTPHVYVADEAGRPVVVHYPFPPPERAADRRLALRRLDVLAHPARLEVCRAIAVEPRSAREIARLWRLDETAVTKHLSALRAAGLVRAERVGHFVRYSLEASAIQTIGADLLGVLRR